MSTDLVELIYCFLLYALVRPVTRAGMGEVLIKNKNTALLVT